MIARPLPFEDQPAPPNRARSARAAVNRRRGVRARARHAVLARVAVIVTATTLVVSVYLGLMANVTRMNYELTKNARTQARLADESARLEDEISQLASRERLAALAAKMRMTDAQSFSQIAVPQTHPDEEHHGIALLSWLK